MFRLMDAPFPVVYAALAVTAYVLWKLIRLRLRPYAGGSCLHYLPGPPSSSWIMGDLGQLDDATKAGWVDRHGETIKIKGVFNSDVLYTLDTKAVHHIISHTQDYCRPALGRLGIPELFGGGLVFAEGERHRQQRKVMNPAFGPVQIRELTEIFVQKALKLAEFWSVETVKCGRPARIDVLDGLSKMTLDVIGLAGFNYEFDALNEEGKTNELHEAFNTIFGTPTNGLSLFRIMRFLFPPLRYLPTPGTKRIKDANAIMRRIGMQLLREKRADILRSANAGKKGSHEHAQLQGRDLLTLLIKANMDADIPESQRLPDEEILAQVSTFLVAGHETTSNATAWALYALSVEREMQQRLRAECLSHPSDNPSMDELNSLPYLEAVVREALRLHPPLSSSTKEAVTDNIIPLNHPVVDTRGRAHDHVKINKGTMVQVPIIAINRSQAIWGDDASEFNPERWLRVPEAAQGIPGVWGNMMTFSGGPRSCIGYRFSLVEMKAMLFTLLRAFEFEPAVPKEDVVRQYSTLQRPALRGQLKQGSQLPMLVKPYSGF